MSRDPETGRFRHLVFHRVPFWWMVALSATFLLSLIGNGVLLGALSTVPTHQLLIRDSAGLHPWSGPGAEVVMMADGRIFTLREGSRILLGPSITP